MQFERILLYRFIVCVDRCRWFLAAKLAVNFHPLTRASKLLGESTVIQMHCNGVRWLFRHLYGMQRIHFSVRAQSRPNPLILANIAYIVYSIELSLPFYQYIANLCIYVLAVVVTVHVLCICHMLLINWQSQ